VDPLGGSYFIETLTSEMEEKILEEMEKVEKAGGHDRGRFIGVRPAGSGPQGL